MVSYLGTITDKNPIAENKSGDFGILVKDAVSYTDAEARIIKFCREDLGMTDFDIKTIVKKKYTSFTQMEEETLEGNFWELKSQYEDVNASGNTKVTREVGLIYAEEYTDALKLWADVKLPAEELTGLNLTKIEFSIS